MPRPHASHISYALVLADRVLPDGDGIDIAESAAEISCNALIVTDHAADLPAGVMDRHQGWRRI